MSGQNLKIITALWGTKYTEDDVKKLPIDIVFSDRNIPGIKTLPIDTSYKNTWRKMTLFDQRLNLGDCLFLDLDIIIQGDLNKIIDYYYQHKIYGKVMLAHVHWFSNAHMKKNKSTYISCNVNSGVFAWNTDECNHIYEELVKYKDRLELLFEGTDKWFYHKHKDWYQFFPDKWIQHQYYNYEKYDKKEAIIISQNAREKWINLV